MGIERVTHQNSQGFTEGESKIGNSQLAPAKELGIIESELPAPAALNIEQVHARQLHALSGTWGTNP